MSLRSGVRIQTTYILVVVLFELATFFLASVVYHSHWLAGAGRGTSGGSDLHVPHRARHLSAAMMAEALLDPFDDEDGEGDNDAAGELFVVSNLFEPAALPVLQTQSGVVVKECPANIPIDSPQGLLFKAAYHGHLDCLLPPFKRRKIQGKQGSSMEEALHRLQEDPGEGFVVSGRLPTEVCSCAEGTLSLSGMVGQASRHLYAHLSRGSRQRCVFCSTGLHRQCLVLAGDDSRPSVRAAS